MNCRLKRVLTLFVVIHGAFACVQNLQAQVETNPPPHVRIVSPLNGSIFLEPANITIVAHAEDSHGKFETVEFFSGSNSLGVKTNLPVANPLGPFVLVWSNVLAGEYTLTAKATDDQGASTVSAPANIKVLHFPNTIRLRWSPSWRATRTLPRSGRIPAPSP